MVFCSDTTCVLPEAAILASRSVRVRPISSTARLNSDSVETVAKPTHVSSGWSGEAVADAEASDARQGRRVWASRPLWQGLSPVLTTRPSLPAGGVLVHEDCYATVESLRA
jgi:hypothetical protein